MSANVAADPSMSFPQRWQQDRMTPPGRSLPEWRTIVIDAYAAQPTLLLTRPQGQRLWGMDPSTCACVLEGLADAGILTRTRDRQYCRPDFDFALDPMGAF